MISYDILWYILCFSILVAKLFSLFARFQQEAVDETGGGSTQDLQAAFCSWTSEHIGPTPGYFDTGASEKKT